VSYPGPERSGTIVIRPRELFLYLVQAGRMARRYGIGVGRQGFEWSGTAQVKRKEKWPAWRPPAEMLRRRPDLPDFMEGGIDNPLGARALYLYQGERDTLYRIHGTNEPSTIGQAVSSGCIRLLNEDVYDLYHRVPLGTAVKVYNGTVPRPAVDGEVDDF
jgi:lipoprotein-anchoring transpeptidase ErfK/SrfK